MSNYFSEYLVQMKTIISSAKKHKSRSQPHFTYTHYYTTRDTKLFYHYRPYCSKHRSYNCSEQCGVPSGPCNVTVIHWVYHQWRGRSARGPERGRNEGPFTLPLPRPFFRPSRWILWTCAWSNKLSNKLWEN